MHKQPLSAVCCGALFLAMGVAGGSAFAFNLAPISADDQQRLQQVPQLQDARSRLAVDEIVEHMSDPAHEILTARIYGCEESAASPCRDRYLQYIPPAVLNGLRWNDNPTFHVPDSFLCAPSHEPYVNISSDPACWLSLFFNAETRAAMGEHFKAGSSEDIFGMIPLELIYRVHFGDMQFLHSMASWDGELPAATRSHVMAWLEFTYKVADGEVSADTPVATAVPELQDVFGNDAVSARTLFMPERAAFTAQDDADIRDMALGSLLHTIEDSFSKAHVGREKASADTACDDAPDMRAPGLITQFYAYNSQISDRHKAEDDSSKIEERLKDENGHPIGMGKNVRAMLRLQPPESAKKWDQVSLEFSCLYRLGKKPLAAGPGPYGAYGYRHQGQNL